jgi:hypothetical protein
LHSGRFATIIRRIMARVISSKLAFALLLCAASAWAADRIAPETFFIPANFSGADATIKVPVGAVSSFSASNAEALTDFGGPEIEAMRLSGDVRIDVIGSGEPIRIKADRVVLELTADDVVQPTGSPSFAGSRHLRSSRIIVGDDASQTFVGNVIYTLQTPSGALQIRADRVEHRAGA